MHRTALLVAAALLAAGSTQLASGADGGARTLHLTATFDQGTQVDVDPAGDSLGDVEVGSGIVTDDAGHEVGRFGSTCTWVHVEGDDILERCGAWGEVNGDQITFEGMSERASDHHVWAVTGGTGRFRRARGEVELDNVSDTETVARIELTG
jgi:hypothetical protein